MKINSGSCPPGGLLRRVRSLGSVVLASLLLSQCATQYKLVADRPEESLRRETFGYRKWLKDGVQPDTVVIALHGFCGAAIDYENLGKRLLKEQPKTAVYAYEIRGQGKDPLKERRGDIDDPEQWYNDLNRFSEMVREKHPKAKIIWFGESMGALIASHTFSKDVANGGKSPCDALVLSSPVVKFRDDFPQWKKDLVRQVAAVAPMARLSLETLAGGQEVQMTHDTFHSQQSETNSWHIDKHTLRLLVALGTLIDGMPDCAKTFNVPTLVLHGDKDFFSRTEDVQAFFGNIPDKKTRQLKLYNDAYHLLMYDNRKDQVIGDVERWIGGLKKKKKG
ncbi:alpha/beta fold hydrolase [Haloferula sp. BvORR071]|uniref:alpha/beta fold hydrolase n=1 Tax=Haloferula sp. BvORR071 TaxID=1396141 RepID=UPI00054D2283|nr:alpha/beta fold hydrolase [Haloferula sp. BvORR071]